MTKSEKISVIKSNVTNKVKIKGSQFIGFAYRIESPDDVMNYLSTLKKEYYDATHHCFGYRTKEGEEKYSDDGEPNGTAGIRIFNSIKHYNLFEILIIVVRYFSGTKLGVGPLGKAYGETAMGLLENAEIIELVKYEKISIKYSYDYVSSIHYLLNKYKCRKINNSYAETPIIEAYIEPFLTQEFADELNEKSAGKSIFELEKKPFYLTLVK